jgi:hypothetical protein
MPELDPEKWKPVFPRDKRGTRLRGDHAPTKRIMPSVMAPSRRARTHRSSAATSKPAVTTAGAHPNRRSRFVRKVRFGARRRDLSALTTKIFLLPNRATQSPCARHFDAAAESSRARSLNDRHLREFKNAQLYRRFMQYRAVMARVASARFASTREHVAMSPTSSHCALSHCCVNTSLSWKLFF